MTASPHRMNALEWLMLLTLSLVWGGSFFFAAVAVVELPPLTVAFVRVAGAALILGIVVRLMRVPLVVGPQVLAAFLVMGLLNNVIPFSLIFWAQTELASGVASILNAMTPIFTVIAAHFLTRDEPMTGSRLAGVILGFVGVFVLLGGGVASGSYLAHFAVLGGAISYAFASIFGKRFAQLGVAPLATATGQVAGSALILLLVVLIADQPWNLPMISAPVVLSLVGLVVLSTAFAYFLYFRILSTAGATNLALVTFLIPPSAIALGILILGEMLTWNHVLGMSIIGAGLAAIDGRILKMLGLARDP